MWVRFGIFVGVGVADVVVADVVAAVSIF